MHASVRVRVRVRVWGRVRVRVVVRVRGRVRVMARHARLGRSSSSDGTRRLGLHPSLTSCHPRERSCR